MAYAVNKMMETINAISIECSSTFNSLKLLQKSQVVYFSYIHAPAEQSRKKHYRIWR